MILILSALLYSGQGLMKGPVSFKTLRFTTAQDTDGNVVSLIILSAPSVIFLCESQACRVFEFHNFIFVVKYWVMNIPLFCNSVTS